MININNGVINFDESCDSLVHYTTIKDLICIGYLDTSAGSNPREFQGMSKVNSNILKSFLKDSKNFWAKHLGINITVKNGEVNRISNLKGSVTYQDACITNGLQTLSLFKIILMIKLYQNKKNRDNIHNKIVPGNEEGFRKSVYDELGEIADELFSSISITQINKVYNWIHKKDNQVYLDILNKIIITDILGTKISIKIVILDRFLDNCDGEYEYKLQKIGDQIALCNNETQNVREDDKFGTKRGRWLDENLLCNVSSKVVDVEYRRFSTKRGDIPTKHILDLLRTIVYTSLIVDSRDEVSESSMVCKYANSRTPVYTLFDKFILKCEENKNSMKLNQIKLIVKNLMPSILNLMFIFEQRLKQYYNNLNIDLICNISDLDCATVLKKLKIREDDLINKTEEEKNEIINKSIIKQLHFSNNNVFSIFIFVVRKVIIINNKLEVELNLKDSEIDLIIDQIYFRLLKVRLHGHIGSTSDIFRDKEIYNDISYTCNTIITNPIKYVEKYRVNLSNF